MSDGMTVMNGGCSEPAEAARGPGWLTQMWGLFWFPTNRYFKNSGKSRAKKGWTQRVGLANVSPKGLYHSIRGWFKLDNGS